MHEGQPGSKRGDIFLRIDFLFRSNKIIVVDPKCDDNPKEGDRRSPRAMSKLVLPGTDLELFTH